MFDLFVSPGCGGNINDRLFRTHLLSFAMGRFGGGSLRQCDAGNLSGVSSGFVFCFVHLFSPSGGMCTALRIQYGA